tara:strand:+ start:239 stop:1204 length:966 start_codon:yes stop_codon:yes gene_type:complete
LENRILKILIIFFAISTRTLLSQSDLTLYDYMNNPITHNPAYVGVTDKYFIKMSHSSQWLGFEGASHTEVFDFQMKFENQINALGLSIINDEFGAVRNLNIELNYGFHTKLSQDLDLVLGLKAGYNHLGVDYNQLNIFDPTESIYLDADLSEPLPIVGAGFYIADERFWFSASAPNFITNNIKDSNNVNIFRKRTHTYLSSGYIFYLNDSFDLRTQLLGQIVKGAPVGYMLDIALEYEQSFMFGIHSNPNSFMGINLGIDIAGNGRLTYGYNFSFNEISEYSNGNHFISFSYYFEGSRRKASNYRGYSSKKMKYKKSYVIR